MNANRLSILFFSRGRGRGHAIPDIAIASELPDFIGVFDLTFASYATGGETLARERWPLVDLRQPESNGFLPTLFAARQVIEAVRPDVVVAHEEFAALPAARLAGIPSVFITDWFPPAGNVAAEALAMADSILFIGEPGTFPLPVPVASPPHFVGPVVRKMAYTLTDRSRARAELDVGPEAVLVSVIPGAWATEERSPIADPILSAFATLDSDEKTLLWMTARDYESISARVGGVAGARVMKDCDAIERVIVASDVVITKGNRGTILDAASLGVPSISLSHGLNAIDEVLVGGVRSNRALNAKAVDGPILARIIMETVSTPADARVKPLNLHERGGRAAARKLAEEIGRLAAPPVRAAAEGIVSA